MTKLSGCSLAQIQIKISENTELTAKTRNYEKIQPKKEKAACPLFPLTEPFILAG